MSTKRSQFFLFLRGFLGQVRQSCRFHFQVLPGAPLARGERTDAPGRSGIPSLVSSDRWPPLEKFPLKAKPYGILGILDLQDGDLRDGYMGFTWVWCKKVAPGGSKRPQHQGTSVFSAGQKMLVGWSKNGIGPWNPPNKSQHFSTNSSKAATFVIGRGEKKTPCFNSATFKDAWS